MGRTVRDQYPRDSGDSVKFMETLLSGTFVIEPEPITDTRGFFARTFCRREFEQHGLVGDMAQCNLSFNAKRATLRGLHYQIEPYAEVKLVRCTMGAIYDVIVDLRPGSVTYKRWISVELSAVNRHMLYIPKGCAHGFQTLVDDTEVFYQMSEFYHPECARGALWNDAAFDINWPITEIIISDKDRSYPVFSQ